MLRVTASHGYSRELTEFMLSQRVRRAAIR